MKTFSVNRLSSLPEYPLPFYPRGAGVNCFEEGYKEDLAPMDFTELCWIKKGNCIIDAYNDSYQLSAGDAIFRMPYEKRRKFITSGPAEIWWATIDGPHAADFIKSFGYPESVLRAGKCPVELFQQITRGLLLGRKEIMRHLLPVYTELFVRAGGNEDGAVSKNNPAAEYLYRLHANYTNPDFNINQLSEETGVHRTTIDRTLRKETGKNPLELLMTIRIDRAKELLLAASFSISETARQCGFRNCNYFCRVFRNFTGLSPSQFRRSNAEK